MTTETISTDLLSVQPTSSKDTVLECSVCVEQYGQDFDHTPRVLRCGHTFCTKCLTKLMIMTAKGAKCPMCNNLHPLDQPNVLQLPPNYAVMQILTSDGRADQEVQNVSEPDCEYCSLRAAERVCIDCSPGNQVKFCGPCDSEWHNRPFPPVQRHRRYPINQLPTVTPTCSVHSSNQATCYSLVLNRFACAECTVSSDWSLKQQQNQFEPIEQAVPRIRTRAQRLNQYSQDVVERLSQSEIKIYQIVAELAPSVTTTKNDIQTTFSGIIDAIQERQQSLMRHVDNVYDERKEKLHQQLDNIRQTHQLFMESRQDLNDLLQKPDGEFLLGYRDIGKKVEELLVSEDRSLQRPVAHQVIPFWIPQETLSELRKLGAVGGGATVQNITGISSDRNNLMQLTWELPKDAEDVAQYEIEYEYLPSRSTASIRGSGLQPGNYSDMEPRSFEIPGNVFSSYVDDLCPGYMYRFRMRSASAAGWGMWSNPIVDTCADFPVAVGYTKKIHLVKIPISGHYRIEARGAKGKDGLSCSGGSGAIIRATFPLKAGDTLTILTGGMSSLNVCDTGGGGGTFVVVNELSRDNLLIAAGGGGGTRGLDNRDENGCDASLQTWGTDGRGHEHGKGGKDGGAGEDANKFVGPCWGFGGAGFLVNSTTAHSFLNDGAAGQYGGFGGGGATGQYGGGGGGGYSGGGGGRGGGGGGSYVRVDGTDVEKQVGNDDHGNVRIEQVPPPYPSPVPSDHGPTADAAAGQSTGSVSSNNSSGIQIYSPPLTEQHPSATGMGVGLISGPTGPPSLHPTSVTNQMSSCSSTSTGSAYSDPAGPLDDTMMERHHSSVFSQSSVTSSLGLVQNLIDMTEPPKSAVLPPLQPVVEEVAFIAMDPTSALGAAAPRHGSVAGTSNAGSQVDRDVLQPLLEYPPPMSNAQAENNSRVSPVSNAQPATLGDPPPGAHVV